VAVDHNVDVVADRVAHGGDGCFGQADGTKPFDRHRRRDGHTLERGVAVFDGLLSQVAKLLRVFDGRFVKVFHLATTEVAVGTHPVSNRPTPQLRARHVGDLSGDVPQCDVDSRNRRRTNNAVAVPEVLTKHHLPEMFDTARIFADEQFSNVLHGSDDGASVPFQGGFSPTDQSRLVGHNFDKHPVAHPSVADECLYSCNLHRWSRSVFLCLIGV